MCKTQSACATTMLTSPPPPKASFRRRVDFPSSRKKPMKAHSSNID
jgi:hypothetical protein